MEDKRELKVLRVHLNHPKIMDNISLRRVGKAVQLAMEKALSTDTTRFKVNLVLSRADRAAFRSRDWNAWSDSVVQNYDCAVGFEAVVGRATADVMRKMLKAGKPVYFYFPRGRQHPGIFKKVLDVLTIDSNDWKSGWILQLLPIEDNKQAIFKQEVGKGQHPDWTLDPAGNLIFVGEKPTTY